MVVPAIFGPPDWGAIGERLASSSLSEDLKVVARHAVGVLEDRLGGGWPAKVAEGDGIAAAVLRTSATHLFAYMRFVELALRMESVKGAHGAGKVRNALRWNPSDEGFLHSSLLLELGALACNSGIRVELEPERSGSRADVAVATPEGEVLVEARVVGRGHPSLAASRWANELRERLVWLRMRGVALRGHIRTPLDEGLVDEIEIELTRRAEFVRRGGVALSLTMPDVEIQVLDDRFADESLEIAIPGFDLWDRLRRALDEKARQTARSGATWLRIDCTQLLWESALNTPSFLDRVSLVSDWTRTAMARHDHLAGIVLSNAAWTVNPSDRVEEITLEPGVLGLRVPNDSLRTRETVVAARDPNDDLLQMWGEIYRRESEWLPRALTAAGLPAPPELLAARIDLAG